MRVLITGARGQLAGEVVRQAPAAATIVSVSRAECDITDNVAVERVIGDFHPDTIINTAAYTAVDRAEDAPEEAFAVNAEGARNVATAAAGVGARVIHISTDYVFDGKRTTPYPPAAEPNPLNVYGASKLAGERGILSADSSALIVRTGWLYSAHGRNFVRTILAALKAGRELRVVDDQVGVPSSARDLASAIWACVELRGLNGIYHWVNDSSATWYEFAVAIREIALDLNIIASALLPVPISTAEYGSRASRPRYSVLDASALWSTLGGPPEGWRLALRQTIEELRGEWT
jgi:dTDP-4-dehydrorhamnose reductase